MTRKEALAEARRRWGADRVVLVHVPRATRRDDGTWRTAGLPRTYFVGVNGHDGGKGFGSTWEAAFADADRRAVKS